MITKTVLIQIFPEDEKLLLAINDKIEEHLKEGKPLSTLDMEALFALLSRVAGYNAGIKDAVALHDGGSEHVTLNLQHADNRILNLPWLKAKVNDKELAACANLFITKSLPGHYHHDQTAPLHPAPLKVLVMISSPEDLELKKRLSFEQEELLMLKAFEGLMQRGEVEIDFADDASLETLRNKLKENHYHILHFTGHASYDQQTGKGYLEMEDAVTMKREKVEARDFADALNYCPEHKPALVIISSCESAQGSSEAGLQGISNQLMRLKVPAVVSMGWSIGDDYAAHFTAALYSKLAAKSDLLRAFKESVEALRTFEAQEQAKANAFVYPLQFIIPSLYVTQPCDKFVDWNANPHKLRLQAGRYLFSGEKLLIEHDKEFVFIGRRSDKKKLLSPLFDHQPVMMCGQGGTGKTSMAEHLVRRIIARGKHNGKDFRVFAFNEENAGVQDWLESVLGCFKIKVKDEILSGLKDKKLDEKIQYVIEEVTESFNPIFIFDNMESFQDVKSGEFRQENAELAQALQMLCRGGDYHLIITSRYPFTDKGFEHLAPVDLGHVSLNDFWKKCHTLGLELITAHFREQRAKNGLLQKEGFGFSDIVEYLYETFGGNYRALEWFATKVKEDNGNMAHTLANLDSFREKFKYAEAAVKQKMSQNLIFDELTALLNAEQLLIFYQLAQFQVSVTAMALTMQENAGIDKPTQESALSRLHQLTLMEKSTHPASELVYYYVTPLIKELLHKNLPERFTPAFSPNAAGHYHLYAYHNYERNIADYEEAFAHFLQAGNRGQVGELGLALSRLYYDASLYLKAFNFAFKSYDFLKEDTPPNILNRLGLIFKMFGKYEQALQVFLLARQQFIKANDKKGEGATLNNLATTAYAGGDYKTALQYLEQSLKIQREIGDKAGEGTTLNNISQIYDARGDYQTALQYLEQSLKIRREIGDIQGESVTLNNMSSIYKAWGNYEKAMEYALRDLKIVREIGDKAGEGTTLNNLATTAYAGGDYKTALEYLEQSLKIRREIGNKAGEGATLNNIGQIYKTRGDYNTALEYLEQSLKITREIGDKAGEGNTLNNISQIYDARGDYKTALEYLEQSLKIQQEIGDKASESTTLNNISGIYRARGDYNTTLQYLEQSLKIQREIGDKAGMIPTLHNMAHIALEQEDIEKYLKYHAEAWQLANEIKDAMGLFQVGQALGFNLCRFGDTKNGLEILKIAYAIGQQSGLPGTEEIGKVIAHFENSDEK
jgi:tetratricopeptide (TPR) repeat protein